MLKNTDYFNPGKICDSGQIFRMYRGEESVFFVYSGNRRLIIRCLSEHEFELDCDESEYESYWKHFLDLDRDYSTFVDKVDKEDSFLLRACDWGSGIRILNQNVFETMISFIISQQKQIPSIRKCIEALCARFGERHESREGAWYGFPTPESLVSKGPEGLAGLSLGYRERYIYETSMAYITRGLSDAEFLALPYDEAKQYLLSFCGIGEKVANCILLFGGGRFDAFPVDVHIRQILAREYMGLKPGEDISTSAARKLVEEKFGRYAGFKGLVQQWIFAYEYSRITGQ